MVTIITVTRTSPARKYWIGLLITSMFARPGSEELQRHLRFRDYLRTYKAARIHYQQLKYAIAEETGESRKRYTALKEVKARAFINSILEKAER